MCISLVFLIYNIPRVFIHNGCFVMKYPIAATDIPENCSTRTADKRTYRSSASGTVTHCVSLQAVEILTRVRIHGHCDRFICFWMLKSKVLLQL